MCCFQLDDDLTYKLSRPCPLYKFCAGSAIPAMASSYIFDQVNARLIQIRDTNCEIYDPSATAHIATCQAFVSGAIDARLPNHKTWIQDHGNQFKSLILRYELTLWKLMPAIDHLFANL